MINRDQLVPRTFLIQITGMESLPEVEVDEHRTITRGEEFRILTEELEPKEAEWMSCLIGCRAFICSL